MNIRLLFLILFAFSFEIICAQERNKNQIYDIDNVISWSHAAPDQIEQLKKVINTRRDSLESGEKVNRKKVNQQYLQSIEAIFNESQKEAIFGFLVNDSILEKKVEQLFQKSSLNDLPKKYVKLLKQELKTVQFDISKLEKRHKFNSELKNSLTKPLKERLKHLVFSSSHSLNKIKNQWNATVSECSALEKSNKKFFINYHFYLHLENLDNSISNELNDLVEKPGFDGVLKSIAACDAERSAANSNYLQKQDSIVRKAVKEKFKTLFYGVLRQKLTNFEPLDRNYKSLNFKGVIDGVIKEKESKYEIKSKNDAYTSFIGKAEKSGVSIEKAEILWQLIEQRNSDLEAVKKSKKLGANSGLGLIDIDSQEKPQVKKRDFQKKVTELISLKEYSALLGDELKVNANKKSKKQLKEIFDTYKQLTKEQSKEISKKVKIYFYNKELNTNYYKYNKKVQKQKLSVLQFYFEKEYRKLMSSYKIDVDNSNKKGGAKYEF